MVLIPTILCGGAGSRLWPVSRELHPKPFIRLADGQSLLQKAFLRGAMLAGTAEIVTVTNRELFFKTRDEFREVNRKGLPTAYLLEPFGRGTARMVDFRGQRRANDTSSALETETEAAKEMLARQSKKRVKPTTTLGAGKGYHSKDFLRGAPAQE